MSAIEKRKIKAALLSTALIALLMITITYSYIYHQNLPDDSYYLMDNMIKTGKAYDVTFSIDDKEYKATVQLDYDNQVIKCLVTNDGRESGDTFLQTYIDAINEKCYYSGGDNIKENSSEQIEEKYITYIGNDILAIYKNDEVFAADKIEGEFKNYIDTSVNAAKLMFENDNDPVVTLIAMGNILNKAGIDINFDKYSSGEIELIKHNKEAGYIEFKLTYEAVYTDRVVTFKCQETDDLIIDTKRIDERTNIDLNKNNIK